MWCIIIGINKTKNITNNKINNKNIYIYINMFMWCVMTTTTNNKMIGKRLVWGAQKASGVVVAIQ